MNTEHAERNIPSHVTAFLTIDDVPSKNLPEIVSYLEEKGIQAILFAIGEKLEENRQEAVEALRHGMILGNHSYSHPHFSELSLEAGIAEFDRCEELLDRVYDEAGIERRYRPFRFPYGDKGGACRAELQTYLRESGVSKVEDARLSSPWWKENGLDRDVDTFWTFDFAEYRIRPGSEFTEEDVFKRIHDPAPETGMPLLEKGSAHLILLHAHDETEALLPGYYRLFLDHLLENGVRFAPPVFRM